MVPYQEPSAQPKKLRNLPRVSKRETRYHAHGKEMKFQCHRCATNALPSTTENERQPHHNTPTAPPQLHRQAAACTPDRQLTQERGSTPAALPDPQLFGPRIDARVAHHARSSMITCANGTLVCGHSATMACDAPTNVPLAQHPQSSRAITREPRIMRADSQCNHRAAINRETRIWARSSSPSSSSS